MIATREYTLWITTRAQHSGRTHDHCRLDGRYTHAARARKITFKTPAYLAALLSRWVCSEPLNRQCTIHTPRLAPPAAAAAAAATRPLDDPLAPRPSLVRACCSLSVQAKVDANSRRTYYVDHVHKSTTWIDPRPALNVPLEEKKETPKTPLEIASEGRTLIRHCNNPQ